MKKAESAPLVSSTRNFQCSGGPLALAEIRTALEHAYGLHEGETSSSTIRLYDTFEWSFWFAGLILWEQDAVLRLSVREGGWIGGERASVKLPSTTVPRFAPELPASPLTDILGRLTGLRAVQPVGSFQIHHHPLGLTDARQKTICRLDFQEVLPAQAPDGLLLCQARPLRGYEAMAEPAFAILAAKQPDQADEGLLARYLSQQGIPPRPYTLRPAFDLSWELPAREAVRHIVQKMLKIARENEAGLIDDIDTEFLHDQRICVRKIRSVLSLLEGAYPTRQAKGLKKTFSRWGSVTNRLRDLDVNILARADYARKLPPALGPGLAEVFADFSREREGAQASVATYFQSSDYRREAEAVERFFSAPDALPASEASEQPVGPLAAERIYQRYRKMRKIGRALTKDTPDEVLHKLRVHGKKLRYLLEFFSELFAAEEIKPLEKKLRRLQNCLGEFNDLSVQQKSLLEYGHKKLPEAAASVEAGLSLGGLIAILYQNHEAQRALVHEAIEDFISDSVATLFSSTFQRSGQDTETPA